MPKTTNVKRAAAAQFQNAKAIENAFKSRAIFGVVEKKLGNGGFQVRRCHAEGGSASAQATPRGLFTSGTMRIEVGCVVILEGVEARGSRALPMEIVARLDSKETLGHLKRKGALTPVQHDLLVAASASAGAVESGSEAVATEDIFEHEDSGEEFWEQGVADVRHGLKAERKAQEAMRTIAARVSSLKSGKKGVDGGVLLGEAPAMPVIAAVAPADEDEDYADFLQMGSQRRLQETRAVGGAAAPGKDDLDGIIAAEKVRLARLTSARETGEMAAESAAVTRAVAARAILTAQAVPENWDEEEIQLADL